MSASLDDERFQEMTVPPGSVAPTREQRARFLGMVDQFRGKQDGPHPFDPDEVIMVPMRRGEIAALAEAVRGREDPVDPATALARELGFNLEGRVRRLDRGETPEDALAATQTARGYADSGMKWIWKVRARE